MSSCHLAQPHITVSVPECDPHADEYICDSCGKLDDIENATKVGDSYLCESCSGS